MAVTIKDIAAAAGVSRGTVDRVLHDRAGVNPDVAEHIRRVAQSLNFTPNRAARLLAARKQPLKIGCFFPGKNNPFFDDVAAGFIAAGNDYAYMGVSVALKTTDALDAEKHIELMRSLVLDEGCGALCVTCVDTPETRTFINETVDAGVPVIAVNTDVTGTRRLCYIGCDYAQGGRVAAGIAALMNLPEIRLLTVTGSFQVYGHNERLRGFCEALTARGSPYEQVAVAESLDNDDTACAAVLNALRARPDINCIYVASAAAGGVCRAVRDAGRVGGIRIIAHDDTPEIKGLLSRGEIDATLTHEPYRQGYAAIELLANFFMDGKTAPPPDYITRTDIVLRESLSD